MKRFICNALLSIVPFVSPTLAEAEKLPIAYLSHEEFRAFQNAAEGVGEVATFSGMMADRLKEVLEDEKSKAADNDNLTATAIELGGIPLALAIASLEGGPEAAALVLGLGALANLIGQPFIFSQTEGNAVILVANNTAQPLDWKKDVYLASGSLVHQPDTTRIPASSFLQGVPMAAFVVEKNFGFNVVFGVIEFEHAEVANFQAGVAVPYRDEAAIRSKNKTTCRFTNDGESAQAWLMQRVLNSNKSEGLAKGMSWGYRRTLDLRDKLYCQLSSVDDWSTTMLVSLGSEQLPMRHPAIYTKQGAKDCTLVAIDPDTTTGALEAFFGARFDCSKAPESGNALLQDGDQFYARIGEEICPIGVATPAAVGLEGAFESHEFALSFLCGDQPSSVDVRSADGGLQISKQFSIPVNGQFKPQRCYLKRDEQGYALFDCSGPKAASKIFANMH